MKKKSLFFITIALTFTVCLGTLSGCRNVAAHDHDYGNWTIKKEATCTREGARERTCSICGHVDKGVVDTLPHDFDKENKCNTCGTVLKWTEGLAFELKGEGYVVTGIGTAVQENEIVIPYYYEGKEVVEIADLAFTGRKSFSSVSIQNSVKRIGASAFNDCSALRFIRVPDSVKEIGTNAFTDCTSLSEVKLGTGVTEINQLFTGCSALERVGMEGHVKTIAPLSFSGCKRLRVIELPSTLESLGAQAFRGCESLTSLAIPSKITVLQTGLFMNCTDLIRVTLRGKITELQMEVFDECVSLQTVVFPGKKEDWKNITKSFNWIGGESTGDFTVVCTDGTLVSKTDLEYMS